MKVRAGCAVTSILAPELRPLVAIERDKVDFKTKVPRIHAPIAERPGKNPIFLQKPSLKYAA